MRNLSQDIVFRVYRGTYPDVIALWPAVDAGWPRGQYCQSFIHVGQHGAASYFEVILASRPAKPEEYTNLLEEIIRRGYTPHIIKRATARHHETRRKGG